MKKAKEEERRNIYKTTTSFNRGYQSAFVSLTIQLVLFDEVFSWKDHLVNKTQDRKLGDEIKTWILAHDLTLDSTTLDDVAMEKFMLFASKSHLAMEFLKSKYLNIISTSHSTEWLSNISRDAL